MPFSRSRRAQGASSAFALVLALWSAGGCAQAPAPMPAPATPPEPYMRLVRVGDDAYAARLCIREFRPVSGKGPTVFLAGAIHIGDPGYYQALQKHLDAQEVVLFEGVRSTDAAFNRRQREKRKGDADTYSRLSRALGMVSQTTQLDYRRAHFRNADLTLEEIRADLDRAAKEPGEAGEAARAAVAQFAFLESFLMGDNPLLSAALWFVEHDSSLRARMRLMVVAQTAKMAGGGGGDNPILSGRLMETIIKERNDAALGGLAKVLAQKPGVGSVSIFYGAAHLKDMEEKLASRFGYRPVHSEWLTAVTVHPRAEGLARAEIDALVGQGGPSPAASPAPEPAAQAEGE